MDRITAFDRNLLLSINGWNSPAADAVMVFVSRVAVWLPLYLLVLWLIFRRLGWRRALLSTGVMILCIVATDQTANLIKDTVCRLRPCWDPLLRDAVRLIVSPGGQYGFLSGHAANCFAFAVLSSLLLKRKWYTPAILIWAALIGYSRIYLGKHYPLDVLCGALMGVIFALAAYLLFQKLLKLIRDRDALHN